MEDEICFTLFGDVYLIEPRTERAKSFCRNLQLEDWRWAGNRFAVDAPLARSLAKTFAQNGFVLVF